MMCLFFAVMVIMLLWTVVTKPVELLVSYTLITLRTMTHAVFTLFTRTTSSRYARMSIHAYITVVSHSPAVAFN